MVRFISKSHELGFEPNQRDFKRGGRDTGGDTDNSTAVKRGPPHPPIANQLPKPAYHRTLERARPRAQQLPLRTSSQSRPGPPPIEAWSASLSAEPSFLRLAGDDLQLAQSIRSQVRHDGHEILINEPLSALNDQGHRARWLIFAIVIANEIKSFDNVRARLNLAGHASSTSGSWPGSGSLARSRLSIARSRFGTGA